MNEPAGDVRTVSRSARCRTANDGLLTLEVFVSVFALERRQSGEPKEILTGCQVFIVASFRRLDITIEGFQRCGSWSFSGGARRSQAHTEQKNECQEHAFWNCRRVHARNMQK